MATDRAFVAGCLAPLVARIPPGLRLILLSLAIFDDMGPIPVVAAGYGEAPNGPALGLADLSLAGVLEAARIGIRSVASDFLLGGAIWLCFDMSGIRPTFAGIVLGLTTPALEGISDDRLHAMLRRELADPEPTIGAETRLIVVTSSEPASRQRRRFPLLERLKILLLPWLGFAIMPIFAFTTAGITISGTMKRSGRIGSSAIWTRPALLPHNARCRGTACRCSPSLPKDQ